VLQQRNIVTVMYVVYFYINKTKRDGRKLFSFEKCSSTSRRTQIFRHSFSSKQMRFLPERFYPLMSAGLTHKMETLTINDPFLTDVIFPRNLSIFMFVHMYI
jgi:hypothetical protein